MHLGQLKVVFPKQLKSMLKSESKMTVSILNCNDVFLVGTDVECDRYYDISRPKRQSMVFRGQDLGVLTFPSTRLPQSSWFSHPE